MDSVTVAGIDCGTNSIRLMVAEVDDEGLHPVVPRMLRVIRLGQDVDKTHQFSRDALERAYTACREFAQVLQQHDVDKLRFVATSATRDAANRREFEDQVEAILGVRPEVIPGAQEAELSFLGATSMLSPLHNPQPPYLVVDLGGGSTELVLGGDGVSTAENAVTSAFSMNIGSVRMTERHLQDDPPSETQIDEAVADINKHIDEAFTHIDVASTSTIIGVSGTVTTMSALALGLDTYNRDQVDGARIDFSQVIAANNRVLHMSKSERAEIHVIHPGRIDVVGAGALVWSEVLRRVSEAAATQGTSLGSYIASEHGLLDGIVLDCGRRLLKSQTNVA
ncbi:Ppx/GppA phosphatase family protein [Bifidobacterium sp.]|jgi:exopolyphosphatase/guanosine-5'-triphosphate,3'-diphosphate pyrophosphatase|uniref:Ppx/GppA phosphatase family protein n=1 Tax=Bifidobacterium sp. TaxID=41200 RepID=UPI0025B9BDBC|nr:Ppx/GppA phosphatase family protein [Bifidobacterium sp.]MCI1635901.1 Ppx/GppA family phosphatase [Bifidobacterium sp.]